MRLLAALFLLALLATAGRANPSAEAVKEALADAQGLPPEAAQRTRYLSLHAFPPAARAEAAKVLAFWANSLSRESDLIPPRKVSDGLLAVVLDDYGWKAKTWEKLLDVEPYFHQLLEVTEVVSQEYGYYTNAAAKTGWVKTRVAKEVKVVKKTASAQWLPLNDIARLIVLTGSEVPVVRGDWWFYQTAIQKDRKAGYYDWLALGKKEADFQRLIGADVDAARKLKKEIAASIARSGVTLNNRSMFRVPTLTGPYWVTQDFQTSTLKQNTLRLLKGDTDPPQGDASEQYGVLPNGLFAFWLQNKDGARQDTAPDFIASDGQANGTDRRVHVGLSCVRCHVEGIRPLDDWARRTFRGPLQLASPDYEKLKQLRQLYLSDLPKQVKRDQADYADALKATNGLTAVANAGAVSKLWDAYAEHDRTLADVARETGSDVPTVLAVLKAERGALDPILAGLLQTPPLAIRVEHFEETFGVLMTLLQAKGK